MYKIALTLFAFLLYQFTFAQADTTVWLVQRKVEDNRYVLNIPNDWKNFPVNEASGIEKKFDFTGIGITSVINSAPVTAHMTLTRTKGKDIAAAFAAAVQEFMALNDRVQEPGYTYDSIPIKIKTGEEALMLRTRYYRRSKVSNYCKYYCFVYSEKADAVFTLNINLQFKDSRYEIERSNRLREYAQRVFTSFELR